MLIDSGAGADPDHLAERLHVLSNEALKDVKLSLKLRGWFTSNQTLVSLLSDCRGCLASVTTNFSTCAPMWQKPSAQLVHKNSEHPS